ncbi:hypothetical protein FNU76_00610 [Chitinimonas arctica]|uniref:Uncharacterized protein n=1 Tax=Chitinimonas arctica TaxID=2594795 RepID=A0A516S9Z8_9NEIS|nr:hypothetical protein [Chitinimonas arctica]QDQ24966.1 hypothetical protein FNU76_00610 [Chitinimonas arctica]
MLKESAFFLPSLTRVFDQFLSGMPISEGVRSEQSATYKETSSLRANLSFTHRESGNALAIKVDLKVKHGRIALDSELLSNDGRVSINGPALVLRFTDWPATNTHCQKWLLGFEQFLARRRLEIIGEIAKLA